MQSQIDRACSAPLGRAASALRHSAWSACALIVLGASACSRTDPPSPAVPAAAASAPKAPAALTAPVLALKGEVGDLRLRAIDALPPLPRATEQGGEPSDECREPLLSDEARAAETAGWTVYAEREWAGYRAVGVSRVGARLAGMGCVFPDGRLLLFRGGRPVAQVIDTQAHSEDSSAGLQWLEQIEPPESTELAPRDGAQAGTELRVGGWNGPELARLLAGEGSLELVALPALDTYCSQRAKVPRLERLDLPAARKRLFEHGWRAGRPEPVQGEGGMREALGKAGYPEVEDCSGTGMGYCNYQYLNDAGDRLQLTTAGEYLTADAEQAETVWPGVAGYSVRCTDSAAR